MIKLFGKVPYDTPSDGSVVQMQDCIDDCYSNPDCILAFMDSKSHCLLYNYSTTLIINVTKTGEEDGFYVAFKVDLPSDTCPSSLDTFCGSTGTESYCWTHSQIGWIITNLCPEPWKMFVRDDSVTVCLRAFNVTNGIYKGKAIQWCESQGFKLTGVASVEESIWMQGEFLRLNGTKGYWLDGTRVDQCLPDLCNVFNWTDGYTVGSAVLNSSIAAMSSINVGPENCLSVFYREKRNVTLNDFNCDSWLGGHFCGFRMYNQLL